MRYIGIIGVIVFTSILFHSGCGGSGSGDDNNDPNEPVITTRIVNPIRENAVSVGLSTFALGVEGKFPVEDLQQEDGKGNKQGIGLKTVLRAVRNIATNELYTFPEKPTQAQVIDTLSYFLSKGHNVLHEIHILNGPGMRRGSDWFVNSVMGYNVYDEDFVDLIQWNPNMRAAVQDLFSDVVVYAKELEQLGVDVYICPELEDNHQSGEWGSFGVLLHMLQAAGWVNEDGSLRRDKTVRNGGSDHRIPGVRYEYHPHSVAELNRYNPLEGDFVNMDGKSMYFNAETNKPDYLFSENDVRQLIEHCQRNNLVFYIWLADLQGLNQNAQWSYIPYPQNNNRYYYLRQPKTLVSMLLGVSEDTVEILPMNEEIPVLYTFNPVEDSKDVLLDHKS